MHLEPRDAERHHDIRRGVRLGKQILDLFARADVPIGYAGRAHLILRALGQSPALTHGLHDLERALFGHPALNQIQHDIVAAADGLGDGRGLGKNQVAGVSQPHIGAMREARKADERVKFCRLRLLQHPPRKAGAKFRDGARANWAQDRVILIAQDFAGGEDGHGVLIVERNLLRVHAR